MVHQNLMYSFNNKRVCNQPENLFSTIKKLFLAKSKKPANIFLNELVVGLDTLYSIAVEKVNWNYRYDTWLKSLQCLF